MQDRFDSKMMVMRARDLAREIRHSDAYPAILGAVAGGIAGAMMAALIASRFAPPPPSSSVGDKRESTHPSFGARDAVQLLTVVAGLVKQAREWYAQERRK